MTVCSALEGSRQHVNGGEYSSKPFDNGVNCLRKTATGAGALLLVEDTRDRVPCGERISAALRALAASLPGGSWWLPKQQVGLSAVL